MQQHQLARWILYTALSTGLVACSGSENPAAQQAVVIGKAMADAKVPGMAVAYLEDCQLVRTDTFGVANVDTAEPVSEMTVFEAASLSKSVLAYLTMQAVDQGYILLDQPIAEQFDYPRISDKDAYGKITPRMLLSHSSGLPNWAGDATKADRTDTIEFKKRPGEGFSYSGEGFQLMQAFLEQQTGSDLETMFQSNFGDMMPMSTFGPSLPRGGKPALGHDKEGLAENGRPLGQPEVPNAAYTLRTVIDDYARFASTVCQGSGLSDDAMAQMLSAETMIAPAEGKPQMLAWGLGWGVQMTDEAPLYFHWGDNGHFKAFVAIRPETGDGIVYFANGMNGLNIIQDVAEPVVGNVDPLVTWLGYN